MATGESWREFWHSLKREERKERRGFYGLIFLGGMVGGVTGSALYQLILFLVG